ncbi:hypothetical protein GCM10010329_44340 [Streptomyces spiroverticillatus]|uniref:DUF4190 domain-containing protein n=1 Tax=Streptomyces finlayi TaxID=67296 RepID=A0A918WZW7_9ACTN|nr:DUF4190 domain-containing protein [Streptomyces finlayi]GHA16575.1 hypothetical protein GCM10010329_44340 [Streptomyces spiroverticillatus]GHC98749.1 hypothetical protein GCM10010334_41520 [Streptomyces finlayi]
MQLTAPTSRTTRTGTRPVGLRDADGMAVAAFVLGLVGLLVMNVLLGPAAIVLAALALRRGTARRFRAWLGLGLGVADLAVLAVVVDMSNSISWSLA